MTHSDATPRTLTADRLHAALTAADGTARPPDYLRDIVAQAGRTRQRPAWTFLERWLPMDIAVRRQGVPRAVLVFAVLALLVTLLVATVAFIGTRPTLPPLTRATNGLIALGSGGDIVVVEPDGTGRRTLISGAFEMRALAYSPDGRRLAYWSQPLAEGPFELTVVDADGSNPVTAAPGGTTLIAKPVWSPDGSMIAYAAVDPQAVGPRCAGGETSFCTSRIFVAAADGSRTQRIGDPELAARGVSWSPDGSTIAFGGGDALTEVRLYLMNADGTNVRQVGDVRGDGWAFVRTDWSHDGTKIVGQAGATDNIDNLDIWVINADGSGATNVGAYPQGIDEIIPAWAPDRDALTWSADGIVLLEEGADPVHFSGEGGLWSPDGQLLYGPTDAGTIVVMDLDGTVQLTVEGPVSDVSWQPLFD